MLLEERIGARLREKKLTLATAESCTGGLIASRATNVPGASEYFLGGVVAYANEVKVFLLGVNADLLAEHGAVSEPVARQMAEGARKRIGADIVVAVTGIAGPDGGTAEKPVGLVHFAIAGPRGTATEYRQFHGDRDAIKWQTADHAFEMIFEYLL